MSTLNIPVLSFSDFLDIQKFCALKELFLQQDLYFDPYSRSSFEKENITFKVSSFEEINFTNIEFEVDQYSREKVIDILELNFYDDFLLPAITLIPSNFNRYIDIRLKKVFGKEAKIDFFERMSNHLMETVDTIQETKHLSTVEKDLVEAAFICKDFLGQKLNDINKGDVISQSGKIPFNLRKIEVLYLFEQMHIHNIIHKSITRVKLFGLVNQYFTFSGNKTISNSYNAIQDYKDGRKNNQKVLSSLSDKFENIFSQ